MRPDHAPELRRRLGAAGCVPKRTTNGAQELWYSPLSRRSFCVDGAIRSRHTANGVLKQAGLPKAF